MVTVELGCHILSGTVITSYMKSLNSKLKFETESQVCKLNVENIEQTRHKQKHCML